MRPVIDMPADVADWIQIVTEYARLQHDWTASIGEVVDCLRELEHQHQLGNSAACREWLQENSLLFLNWIPSSPEQLGIDPQKTIGEQAVEVFMRGINDLTQDVEKPGVPDEE